MSPNEKVKGLLRAMMGVAARSLLCRLGRAAQAPANSQVNYLHLSLVDFCVFRQSKLLRSNR